MISASRFREQQQPLHPQMQQFMRTGIPPSMHANPSVLGTSSNNINNNGTNGNLGVGNGGVPELTGDSLWDSLYNTTIRTLSLDGLDLLAKSFDNLDPNHQLYAGIAKRQRKLMEYQSEFRRNLEVFCQRANLNPKMWPSCIRHVKPTSRDTTASGLDLLGWSAGKQEGTPTSSNVNPSSGNSTGGEQQPTTLPTPLTPLPQTQQSPKAGEQVVPTDATSTSTSNNSSADAVPAGDSWSPKRLQEQQQQQQEQQADMLPTEIASSSIAENDDVSTNVTSEPTSENRSIW